MPLKATEDNSDKEEARSVPVRRSLRLSSSSPTPSRVLTRSTTFEGSPHPSKLTTKRRLSSELSPNKDKTPVTRRSTRKTSASIPEENLPETKKKTPTNDDHTEPISSQNEIVHENCEEDDTKKIRNKSPLLETITEVDEENRSVTKRVTRSQSNLIVENATSEKKQKKILKSPIVLLEPIKEDFGEVNNVSLLDDGAQRADANDNDKNQERESSNKENLCPKEKAEGKTAPSMDTEAEIDELSCTKSESDSFSVASDAATASSDILNRSLDTNSLEESQSVNSLDSNISVSEETKNSKYIETKSNATNEEKSLQTEATKCESPDIDILHIDTDEEQMKDVSSVPLQSNEETNELMKSPNIDDVDSKIDNLLKTQSFSNSEGDYEDEEQHPFIDGMAEEGEEDTPSEGRNDIIEIGEEINTTESELSSDESYDKNSFIDDEDVCHLLSGDEYDLSLNSPKKSRIIQLTGDSDEEIVRINRVKKEKVKKRRKSRIMKFSESSEEAYDDVRETSPQLQENGVVDSIKTDNASENEIKDKTRKENDEHFSNTKGQNVQDKTEETVDEYLESFKDETQSEEEMLNMTSTPEDTAASHKNEEITLKTRNQQIVENIVTCHDQSVNINENEETQTNKEEIIHPSSTPNKNYVINDFNESREITDDTDKTKANISFNASVSFINESDTNNKKIKKKVVVIENIRVQDIKDKRLSDHINEVIDSLSYGIDNATDVSINLSLNYVDKPVKQLTKSFTRGNEQETKSLPSGEKILDNELLNESTVKKPKKKKGKKRKIGLNLENNYSESNKKLKTNEISTCDKTEASESHISKKKKKKRKNSKNEPIVIEQPEEPPVHRKKRKMQKNNNVNKEIKPTTVLDEAIQEDKKKKLILLTPDLSERGDWRIKKKKVKPSLQPTQDTNTTEDKAIKCSTSENTKKFHVKDFKNLMFFDPTRIRRIDTKEMLKRKIL